MSHSFDCSTLFWTYLYLASKENEEGSFVCVNLILSLESIFPKFKSSTWLCQWVCNFKTLNCQETQLHDAFSIFSVLHELNTFTTPLKGKLSWRHFLRNSTTNWDWLCRFLQPNSPFSKKPQAMRIKIQCLF